MDTPKKIIITGINGFIGSHVASLLRQQHVVYGLDTGSVCIVNDIEHYTPMVLPHPDLEGLVKTFCPDYCIHCAGSASVPFSVEHPSIDFNAGPITTFHILDAIRKSKIQCCTIFFSSAAVYGNPAMLPVQEEAALKPISPYGYHKVLSEEILKEFHAIYGLQYVILRIFSAYGNGQKKQLLWDTCQRFQQHNSLFWGTGEETRDFIHIKDIARLIQHIIKLEQVNKIFNVGAGEQVSIRSIIETIAGFVEYPKNQIRFKGNERTGDPLNWQADVSGIRDIGFQCEVLLKDGIREYVQWVKSLEK
jgi:UDP-glucose 4-epimerase